MSFNLEEIAICPAGFICDTINNTLVVPLRMYNCTILQESAIEKGYGAIFDGIVCEKGSSGIQNCPAGHYCSDPSKRPIECPTGYYCPAKSARPDQFRCKGCKNGATKYSINALALGIIVGLTVILPFVIFITIQIVRKRRRVRTVDENIPTDASTHGLSRKMRQILESLDEHAIPEVVKYNGHDLFEAIDTDQRGILSIKEICQALNGNLDQLDSITSYHRKDSKPLLLKGIPKDESFTENDDETSTNETRVHPYSKMLQSFLSQSSFYTERRRKAKCVTKDELAKIIKMIRKKIENRHPIDIQFRNIFLYVPEKSGHEKIVVNDITGHLQSGKLAVIMGESGCGKTSLIESIGGRAFHGRVEGEIYVNGILRQIEHFSDHIGFVPKDDVMHAELTIKENFLFTGKLTLPRGTSIHDILALASDVINDLGLERVANSIVGDISRRGVSGGEKKRVNIGLELMRKPSVLFLDEPTSGLDASSAMYVMHSLSKLVRNQGMTICATIHQPRKQIFDMFDSLILLGVGGKLIYHGEVSGSKMSNYFNALGYKNINNDPLADWMIDISSGYLAPINIESHHGKKSAKHNRDRLYKAWNDHVARSEEYQRTESDPLNADILPRKRERLGFLSQVRFQFHRCMILFLRNWVLKAQEMALLIVSTILISSVNGQLQLSDSLPLQIPNEYYTLTSIENPVSPTNPFNNALGELFKDFIFRMESDTMLYFSQISVTVSLLTALSSAKVLSDKRNEFFREAASGFSINAYFLAINLFTTFEVTIRMVVISAFVFALRNTASNSGAMILQFVLCGWISSAWGFLYALIVPPSIVVLVATCLTLFAAFCLGGVSGAIITYSDIYKSAVNAVVAGFLSPVRFIVEALALNELKATPVQYGFTGYTYLDTGTNPFSLGCEALGLGLNDAKVGKETTDGWYWTVPSSICIGISIRLIGFVMLNTLNRTSMLKKPILQESPKFKMTFIVLIVLISGFLVGTGYLLTLPIDKYGLCNVPDKSKLGDGICDGGEYNTKFCRYDGGDCENVNIKLSFLPWLAECPTKNPEKLMDGICDEENNLDECKWDGFDCLSNCLILYFDRFSLGDGICNPLYNIPGCMYDGGDCIEFNTRTNAPSSTPSTHPSRSILPSLSPSMSNEPTLSSIPTSGSPSSSPSSSSSTVPTTNPS